MSKSSRKRGRILDAQARELIVKLHTYFEREAQNGGPLISVTQVQERVADALGIGRSTVGRIIIEKYGQSGLEDNVLKTPGTKRKRGKPVSSVAEANIEVIKEHIFEYYTRGEYPSLKKLCASLSEAGLFKGSVGTLQTILKQNGFEYKNVDKSNKAVTIT